MSIVLNIKYAYFQDDIDNAFRAYAGIEFEYRYAADPRGGQGWLPAPASACTAPAGQWPPLDCNTGLFYYDYAEMHRDTTLGFAVFAVNHLFTNSDTTSCSPQWYPAASNVVDKLHPGARFNAVPPARAERFTFVFIPDVDNQVRKCFRDGRAVMAFVMTHEFGHQRAGLSHNISGNSTTYGGDLHVAFHNGKLPSGESDIMEPQLRIGDLNRSLQPHFDSYDSVRTNDTSSCGGNLFRARSFH